MNIGQEIEKLKRENERLRQENRKLKKANNSLEKKMIMWKKTAKSKERDY